MNWVFGSIMVQILRKNRKHWVLEKVENLELKDIKYRKMWDEKKRKLRALNIENGKHGCSKINIPLEMGAARPNKLLTLLTQLSLIALLLPLILLTLLTLLTLHTLHNCIHCLQCFHWLHCSQCLHCWHWLNCLQCLHCLPCLHRLHCLQNIHRLHCL